MTITLTLSQWNEAIALQQQILRLKEALPDAKSLGAKQAIKARVAALVARRRTLLGVER